MVYQVTIERPLDSKRFRRMIVAATEQLALRNAIALLGADAADYYAIAIEQLQLKS